MRPRRSTSTVAASSSRWAASRERAAPGLLEAQAQPRQRRAELVRGVRDELALRPQEPREP